MLIDARHLGEIRVVVSDTETGKLLEYDFESTKRSQTKGNIYLGRIIRVEPSLQAAFVAYGENRHGFLAFSDIHMDYYKLPDGEKLTIKPGEVPAPEAEVKSDEITVIGDGVDSCDFSDSNQSTLTPSEFRKDSLYKNYKIQDVIKKNQVILVQVAKEERGEKGAALTTYLTIAGRYCVLMPNAGRSGGVSRKINDAEDRKRLKEIVEGLSIPDNMGLIVRTAGMERTKAEISRDLSYLVSVWNSIREKTLASVAPALIHTEGSIIHRSIRDTYSSEISEIIVDGEDGYNLARSYMRGLIPSHVRKIKKHTHESLSLFQEYNVEKQVATIYQNTVELKSGGYIVINQTEALVAIDVNSGKSTKSEHIDDTALHTNLEAADEIARQLRLRDLAGLVVVDFIDMSDESSINEVEKRFKQALMEDKARIQVGKISNFGLLEMSRQRLRLSVLESTTTQCGTCGGSGRVKDPDALAFLVMRLLEGYMDIVKQGDVFSITVADSVALKLLNESRRQIVELEDKYGITIEVNVDSALSASMFKMMLNGKDVTLSSDAKHQRKVSKHALKRKQKNFKNKDEEEREEALPDSFVAAGNTSEPTEKLERHSKKPYHNHKNHHRRRNHFNRRRRGFDGSSPSSGGGVSEKGSAVAEESVKKPWWKRLLDK